MPMDSSGNGVPKRVEGPLLVARVFERKGQKSLHVAVLRVPGQDFAGDPCRTGRITGIESGKDVMTRAHVPSPSRLGLAQV